MFKSYGVFPWLLLIFIPFWWDGACENWSFCVSLPLELFWFSYSHLVACITPRKWVSFKCRWHSPLHLLLHVHLLASRTILVDALWTPVLDLKLLLLWLISAVLLFSWTSDDNRRIPGQVNLGLSWNYLIKKVNITRYNSFFKKKICCTWIVKKNKKIHDLVLFKELTTNICRYRSGVGIIW